MSGSVLRVCGRHLSLLRGARSALVQSTPARLTPSYSPASTSSSRGFTVSPYLLTDQSLEKAKERLSVLTEEPSNDIKLRLYGLYKQATIGPCNIDKPGMMDFVGKAKWDAWNALGSLSQSEAVEQYCKLVDQLVGPASESKGQSSADAPTADGSKYKEILVTREGGALTITLNRPNKYNAINYRMYSEWQQALTEAGEDEGVVLAVLTGAGDYYCSGNDLSNFMNIPPEGPQKMAADAKFILRDFIEAFINFPKPLIAAVNGPAIGVSVTTLGLCDLVYAADNATFHTPFMSLGQSPEGCSSFLFPQIMGPAKANEMLLAGRKLTAQEAFERNLVSQVFPASEFRDKMKEIITDMANLPPQSLSKSKELMRGLQREMLEEVNLIECELLEERWLSEECMKAIMGFMQRKK